jgi:hypothetical protein
MINIVRINYLDKKERERGDRKEDIKIIGK